MREFCAGHACSPESSGRKLQGGGGHTFEGSLSSPLSSGSLGSVLLPPADTKKNSSFLLGRNRTKIWVLIV